MLQQKNIPDMHIYRFIFSKYWLDYYWAVHLLSEHKMKSSILVCPISYLWSLYYSKKQDEI